MLRLMKYEFQKQMFSKIIIIISLAVMVCFFAIATFMGNEDAAAIIVGIMATLMMIAMVFVGIEGVNVYEKDLKTKQSYMLFMVPQTSRSILGAKIISAVLQILFTMLIFTITIAVCGSIYLVKYSNMREIIKLVKMLAEEMLEIQIDYALAARTLAGVFILWVFLFMLGIFVVTLLNTVLYQSKFISVLSIVAYFLIFWGVARLETVLSIGNPGTIVKDIVSYIYYIVIDVILFFVSAWLIEKKLSV